MNIIDGLLKGLAGSAATPEDAALMRSYAGQDPAYNKSIYDVQEAANSKKQFGRLGQSMAESQGEITPQMISIMAEISPVEAFKMLQAKKEQELAMQKQEMLMTMAQSQDPNVLRALGIATGNTAAVTAAGQLKPEVRYNPENLGYDTIMPDGTIMPAGARGNMPPVSNTQPLPQPTQSPATNAPQLDVLPEVSTVNPSTQPVNIPAPTGLSPKAAQETNAANIKKAYETDVKTASDISTSLGKLQQLMPKYDALIQSIEQAPDMMFGKIAGQISPQVSPEAQNIASMAKELVLIDKEAKNMGSQGFTDKDRQFLEDIQGGLTVKKPAALAIIKRLKAQTERDLNLGKQKLDLFNKTGSMSGAEKIKLDFPEGAKQAPDGNYYIQQNGKWFKVD
jgi:hypothetical protein